MVNYIENLAAYGDVLTESSDKLVVIDFTATWCPPCRMIGPIFEALAAETPSVAFYKVDVDAAADVAGECGISAMPTFQFFKGGQKIAEFSGADEKKLKEYVQKYA